MKSSTLGAAAVVLGQTSSAFTTPMTSQHNKRIRDLKHAFMREDVLKNIQLKSHRDGTTGLLAKTMIDAEDSGDDDRAEAANAFIDVIIENMYSLKKRLENGLNPDVRFAHGNTLLHLIALRADAELLDDDDYRNVLAQLFGSGADLKAENDEGFTALKIFENNDCHEFADNVRAAQIAPLQVSFKRDNLDKHLATFSLQKQPTPIGKKWIVELVKAGADPRSIASNGETVYDNIDNNWSDANSVCFHRLVIAAKLNSAANSLDKNYSNPYESDKWLNAVTDFYKAI